MASLKRNIVLNYINTLASIVFPIITFPYASRILLPNGIGLVNFQNSVISYVTLFTSLGIPLYAVREVARCRDNVALRNKTTVEIAILSLVLCVVGYVAVFILGEFVPRLHHDLALFYILSLSIVFTALGVEWFYKAIEDFKFITIKGLVIRALFVIALFVFVKSKHDILIYGLVVVGSTVGNNIVNFFHLRKYVKLDLIPWKELDIKRHVAPALHIFVLNLIISLYVQLNAVMLGFMDSDAAVGLFTAGSKISNIILAIVTSMGAVMLPRCSHLIETHQLDKFKGLIGKSYHFTIAVSLPLTAGLMLLARPVTLVFCGSDFVGAVLVVIITAPVIVFISLTNLLGIQILYPMGKENLVIISTLGAAIVNIVLNIFLIPRLAAVGTAISTFVAELVVLLLQVGLGYRHIPFRAFDKSVFHYIAATCLMSGGVFLAGRLVTSMWLRLVVSVVAGMGVYCFILLAWRDEVMTGIVDFVRKKVINT